MEYVVGLASLVLIALVALPFLLLLAAPWILVAWIVWKTSRKWLSSRVRIAACTFPIALGTAPLFGAHASVFPAYIVMLTDPKSWLEALVSFLVAWVVLFAVGVRLAKHRTQRGPVQSNP